MLANRDPNMIHLGGPCEYINDDRTSIMGVEATPGMLLELYNKSSNIRWRPHSSATNQGSIHVLLDQPFTGHGVDDVVAAEDLAYVGAMEKGSIFWGLVNSGETITYASPMQSAGNGRLKAATAETAAANVSRFRSLEHLGTVNEVTRCRVEVV